MNTETNVKSLTWRQLNVKFTRRYSVSAQKPYRDKLAYRHHENTHKN